MAPGKTLYFPALDGLRFVAFLLVFVHHLPRSEVAPLRILGEVGWAGVHVFLFLSAYLLTAILRSEQETQGRISVRRFLIRRALRIWPLYFAFCGLTIGWTYLRRSYSPDDLPHLLGLSLFSENWVSGSFGYSTILFTPHLWTISLEEQFYLLLPWLLARWLAVPKPKALTTGLLVSWIIFVAARGMAITLGTPHPWIWTSLFCADSLLLGTWLGARRASITLPSARRLASWLGSAAVVSPSLLPAIERIEWHHVPMYSFVAVGAALICTACIDAPTATRVLGNGPLRYLGKISYGLYVFHIAAIEFSARIVHRLGMESWLAMFTCALSLTIAISALSYQVLEKPFLRVKRRFESVHTRAV